MGLLDVVTTFPVVQHHLVPNFVYVRFGLLKARHFYERLLGISQGLLRLLRYKTGFRLLRALFLFFVLLLLLDVEGDFLDVDPCLVHYLLVATGSLYLKHLHHGAPLLHLDMKLPNVPQ